MVELHFLAVGDGPVGEKGGEAGPARFQQHVVPADVEIGILLAGKGRVGQILGRGA